MMKTDAIVEERGREANRNAAKREALEAIISECVRRRNKCYKCAEAERQESIAAVTYMARYSELDDLVEDLIRLSER